HVAGSCVLAQRAGRKPARRDHHPAGDQGRRRHSGRNRGAVMSDISNALGIDPSLARMHSADAAMLRAKAGMHAAKTDQIKQTADDFESMFVAEMLGSMFDSLDADPMFGGGQAEDTWRGLMVQEYGKEIVKAGG